MKAKTTDKKILYDDLEQKSKGKQISKSGKAALTHFIHNSDKKVKEYYKKEAIQHLKELLEIHNSEVVSSKTAEESIQYMLFDFSESIPFTSPKKPKFKFIDLFAGIGGFRIAMQSLNFLPEKSRFSGFKR